MLRCLLRRFLLIPVSSAIAKPDLVKLDLPEWLSSLSLKYILVISNEISHERELPQKRDIKLVFVSPNIYIFCFPILSLRKLSVSLLFICYFTNHMGFSPSLMPVL